MGGDNGEEVRLMRGDGSGDGVNGNYDSVMVLIV